jgi:exoribonuclease R
MDLDSAGAVEAVELHRAIVRNRAKLAYEHSQADLDAGRADEQILLLKEIGELRIAQEIARGGIDLPTPEQYLGEKDGASELVMRVPDPIERWNAQISLMTGMAAADIMLAGGVGLLRTMPPPRQFDVDRLRRVGKALKINWPKGASHADVIRSLDPRDPKSAAFLAAVPSLLKGSDYAAFDGELPEQRLHSGIAAPYAHVTAPLRRLVDRFGLQVAHALANGLEVPEDVRASLPELPEIMRTSRTRTRAIERQSIDYLEAVRLSGLEGTTYTGVIIDQRNGFGIVEISDPAIIAPVGGNDLPVGEWVEVTLVSADMAKRAVRFELASAPGLG